MSDGDGGSVPFPFLFSEIVPYLIYELRTRSPSPTAVLANVANLKRVVVEGERVNSNSNHRVSITAWLKSIEWFGRDSGSGYCA